MTRPRVIIGIDWQEVDDARPAIVAGARAVNLLRGDVRVVHGLGAHVAMRRPLADTGSALDNAQSLVQRVARRVSDLVDPGVTVASVVSPLEGPEALLRESAAAALVVLQRRSRGPVARVVLGSTTSTVAAQADCPVLILHHRDQENAEAPVLVAVDDRGHSLEAVRKAFVEADRRRVSLTVLHAYEPEFGPSYGYVYIPPEPDEVRRARDQTRADATEAIAGYQELLPDVRVEIDLVKGCADDALVAASRQHQLLVLARHTDRHHGTLNLGQVTRSVIERAACPVLVTPSARPARRQSLAEREEDLATH